MKVLVVVDMQNDFVTDALGTPEARAVTEAVCRKIRGFDGTVVFTRDTHTARYLETQEGRRLPVVHCVEGTQGHALHPSVAALSEGCRIFDKPSFGSVELAQYIAQLGADSVTFVGVCTDICVISNALLVKAFLPEAEIFVDASCCAGVTPESHLRALESMKTCQITVENEK